MSKEAIEADNDRIKVSRVMQESTSSFYKHLGMALEQADYSNARKVKENWRKAWDLCLEIGNRLDILRRVIPRKQIAEEVSIAFGSLHD